MIGVMRRVLGTALGVGLAVAVAALSQVPYVAESSPDAMLRLSWRSRGERIEHCRQLTAEEQENLPTHMRQREICEGKNALYRLTVEVDGVEVLDQVARGSGTRQRRPIFVFRETRLTPGRHRIQVRFVREGQGRSEGDDQESREGRDRDATLPPRLELETTVALEPREVVLVTYDADRRRLAELRAQPSPTAE
jgi:hypothetical protein